MRPAYMHSQVRLRGYFTGTELDGNKAAFQGFLQRHVERSAMQGSDAPDPSTFPSPMRLYDARTARRVGEMRGRSEQQGKPE